MELKNLFKKSASPAAGADGLLLFYLPGCPYCRQAETIIA